MTESALSDEADALYQPLAGVAPWVACDPGPLEALGPPADGEDGAWAELLARGVLLAAAHQSGALDGMHDGDRAVATSLLRGTATLGDVGEDARAHALANYEALLLARAATDVDLASDRWMREVHRMACRPQLTHPVRGEHGLDEHVLGTGDFKHHPNHHRGRSGAWTAHAPVSMLTAEMGRFLDVLRSEGFRRLPPAVQAAYAHHGLAHVAPFADGNGRVARALAGAHLLRAASVPLLVFADGAASYEDAVAAADAGDAAAFVAFVAERWRSTVELVTELRAAGPSSAEEVDAVARWRGRADAAAALAAHLPGAVERALDRHRRRPDLGWLSPLTGAGLAAGSPPLVLRDRTTGVEETLEVDAHPILGGATLVLRAVEARLNLDVAPADVVPSASATFEARCDAWLDRTVSTFALRVAAESE